MNLTKEEKEYCEKYSVVYKKYGGDIPTAEWLELSDIRKELNISLNHSQELIELVQSAKYATANPARAIAPIAVDVNEENIIQRHPYLQQQREQIFAERRKKMDKLKTCQQEQACLQAPYPVSDPGSIGCMGVLVWYGIAIATWHLWGLGIIIGVFKTIMICNHFKNKKKFENYTIEHEKFLKTKKRLKTEIPQLLDDTERLLSTYLANLYAEVNNGCSIPISREYINLDNCKRIDKKLNTLVDLLAKYKQASEADKREFALKYFDAKLQFFYEESLWGETTAEVYCTYRHQLEEAEKSQDMNVLRMDNQKRKLLTERKYWFTQDLETYKQTLSGMNMDKTISQYYNVKDMTTTGNWGFADIDKLAVKTKKLRKVFDEVKLEYERLQELSEKVNFILMYMRSVAYRNVYLGVELLNFIRDNAGGKKLMAQKDMVETVDVIAVGNVDADMLQMDSVANVASSLTYIAQNVLQDKDTMKLAMKNPKMAAGAAALVVVGNFLSERYDKINTNVDLQKQFVDGIDKMVDGYDSGKAGLLRAIEIIKALSKANIGFLAIYAPLRDKFFVDGCRESSMLDLQNLAKATQEYKHISDTKL